MRRYSSKWRLTGAILTKFIVMKVFIKRDSGRKAFTTNKKSTFSRTVQILNELGIDKKDYEKDARLRELNRMQAVGIEMKALFGKVN